MKTNQLPQRRRVRLEKGVYAQVGSICSITIAVKDRARIFERREVAAATVEILKTHAAKSEVPIYAYCVMPDHIHLLLAASARCDIITFVGQFKNLVQRAAWANGVRGAFWQRSFWDHFIREEEQVEAAIDYVLNNPVRRGLADCWRAYPFGGSLFYDLEKADVQGAGR
jgi:REP element-mobilizing transposase RayT